MNRREFLGISLGALVAPAAGAACGRAAPARRARPDVVVVGAGLAGLAAAGELLAAGCRVTVLEARDRPGGRVLTLRHPFDDGLHAEAGAVFVPANHAETLRYASAAGVALDPAATQARGRELEYHVNGRAAHAGDPLGRWPVRLRPDEARATLGALRARYLDPVLERIGDPSAATWPSANALELDSLSLASLLRRQGASPEAAALLALGYAEEWGDGAEACSALFLLRDFALAAGNTGYSVVRGGSDRLPRALAERMREHVRYRAPVRRIEASRHGVRVETDGGAYAADRAVIAIPFSVLRTIPLSAPLRPGKRGAIAGLRHTSITRVYAQTSSRIWEGKGSIGQVATDLPITMSLDATAAQPGTRGILEAFAAGPKARRLAAMSGEARARDAIASLGRIFPGLERRVERWTSVCWDLDPWARGDYCWFAPGEMRRMLPEIARPEGRLHFAGDHTSPWPGWMQGALASGERAAREILDPPSDSD